MEMLRILRKKKGISMKELGSKIGVAESTISQYETGKREPDFETLLKLSEFFDVSTDYLLRGDIYSGQKESSALTKKDKQDIEKELQATLERLETEQGALMFSGEPLDEETKQLLAASLRNSLEFARRTAQQKYTPKKYRKN